jgi:hypothetical protein
MFAGLTLSASFSVPWTSWHLEHFSIQLGSGAVLFRSVLYVSAFRFYLTEQVMEFRFVMSRKEARDNFLTLRQLAQFQVRQCQIVGVIDIVTIHP